MLTGEPAVVQRRPVCSQNRIRNAGYALNVDLVVRSHRSWAWNTTRSARFRIRATKQLGGPRPVWTPARLGAMYFAACAATDRENLA